MFVCRLLEEMEDEEDFISKMNDDILGNILSLLDETKDAVRTSVLSSRWKELCTLITKLYLVGNSIDFLQSVEHLVLRCRSKTITDFHLQYQRRGGLNDSEVAQVFNVLSFVAERNVQTVFLKIFEDIRLPESLITCKSLVKLTLAHGCIKSFPTNAVIFPSLKFLSLNINIPDRFFLCQSFINKCPVLEELIVSGFVGSYGDRDASMLITLSTLRRLKLDLKSFCVNTWVLLAPNLESLCVTRYGTTHIEMEPNPFLCEVVFACDECKMLTEDISPDREIGFVNAIAFAKNLRVSGCFIWVSLSVLTLRF